MKRLIFGGLSLLLMVGATVPSVRAQEVAANPAMSGNNPLYITQTTPFNLVHLAYRGYFTGQGIPSYTALLFAHQTGQVSAEDLVKIAIAANRVPSEVLADRGYVRAVEALLDDLNTSE